MASTQEHNGTSVCSLYLLEKLIVPIYFGTKTSLFCLRNDHFFFITGVRDSKINFDRARSTTVKSRPLLGALRALYNISSDDGKTSLRTSCFYIRNGKLDTKWRRRKTKTGKKTQGLLWMVNCESLKPVQLSLARMYFVKVWLFY